MSGFDAKRTQSDTPSWTNHHLNKRSESANTGQNFWKWITLVMYKRLALKNTPKDQNRTSNMAQQASEQSSIKSLHVTFVLIGNILQIAGPRSWIMSCIGWEFWQLLDQKWKMEVRSREFGQFRSNGNLRQIEWFYKQHTRIMHLIW